MAMQREDANSLDDLLDEIQHLSGRNDEQRAEIEPRGSDVFLNVYDMVKHGGVKKLSSVNLSPTVRTESLFIIHWDWSISQWS